MFWTDKKITKLIDNFQPRSARLDACSLCQLNCKDCYMRRSSNNCGFGAGWLTCANFQKFLDLNPSIRKIEISNNGEIFLNPELAEIIRLAHSRQVRLTADNGVNFNNVSDELMEALIKYKFYWISISIDGWDQKSYSAYRRKGDFDRVITNIRRLNELKKKYNSEFPGITWKYIILESSDSIHGIRKAKDLAAALGTNMWWCRDWGGYIPQDPAAVLTETGQDYIANSVDGSDANSRFHGRWCYQLLTDPQVNWDGRFYGCCINRTAVPGNLFEVSLRDFFQTNAIQQVLKDLCGLSYANPKSFCSQCLYYKSMAQRKDWLHKDEVSDITHSILF